MTKAKTPKEPTEEPVQAPVEADAPAPSPEEALAEELAEVKDKLLRSVADYDNLRKRHARDAELERERIRARILEPFLQVFEYARLAAAEAEKTPGALAEGVKMLTREFERTLHGEGLVPFGEVGDRFDANLHEAVAEEPADGVAAGAISRVLRPGYRLGERVLRYAKVAVAPRDD